MKRINLFLIIAAFIGCTFSLSAQQYTAKEKAMIDSLTTLDQDIVKYFPRWKVCEPDLQIHIQSAFLGAGYDRSQLNLSDIEILAAPGAFDVEYGNFQILLISCGDASMKTYQIEQFITSALRKKLTGEISYTGTGTGRTYCYKEIPIEVPVSTYQAEAILDYLRPTDVDQSFSLSLFEQSVKIGNTGFWLSSKIGNDQIGYQFWSSGEGSIELQRPLYLNKDVNTSRAIPYLINAYLGGGYRVNSGINPSTFLSWVQERTLNGTQNGSLIGGLDFHLPVLPQAGISFQARVPMSNNTTKSIEVQKWGKYELDPEEDYVTEDGRVIESIVPVSKASGHIALFYNWWLDKRNPENYIRFDAGIAYSEVEEMGFYYENKGKPDQMAFISNEGIQGLKTYKPSEAMDWLYMKLEYRNQATFPFGASAQLSNNNVLGRIWIPLFGDWLYIEMKYSTPLRERRPYEIGSFFMISPVLRLTI
ncbi:MAG: hypothetical protein IJK61_05300 [Bacteroidetes bacterium]|nr:hypothetical protein [Bacteroidota bacterium]MBR3090939.1 hypothetical protein [Bacteroidota bacterium]